MDARHGRSRAIIFNLAVLLRETALTSPDRPVVVHADGQMSYAELDALSSRLAAGLGSAGIGPGDLVGLQLPNIPHERLGEEVMAMVTLREGATVTAAELHAYCRERIAAYKYPRLFEFRAQLPENSLGKVLKDELIPQQEQLAGKDTPWSA